MSKVRVNCFATSIDGYGAGPRQDLESPLGVGGEALHEWFFPTQAFRAQLGQPGGSTGVDNALACQWGPGIGVEIMGRNKFGPQRGPWTDEEWKGWWGEEPPFHTPCFVMTHYPRDPMVVGETTFHFVSGTPAEVLAMAREAAGGLDVRLGGMHHRFDIETLTAPSGVTHLFLTRKPR